MWWREEGETEKVTKQYWQRAGSITVASTKELPVTKAHRLIIDKAEAQQINFKKFISLLNKITEHNIELQQRKHLIEWHDLQHQTFN